jgi:hypothetical protein
VLRRFEQALPAAVDLALAGAGDLRPFALALLYDAEQPIPPSLWAGSRDDIDAGLNPAEWDGPELSLPLEPLGIDVAVLAGVVGREGAQDDVLAALSRTAKKLNRTPPESWREDPPVIFAVDFHLKHLRKTCGWPSRLPGGAARPAGSIMKLLARRRRERQLCSW